MANHNVGHWANMIWRLIKFLFFIAVLAAVGLIAFAYVGPIFGFDFSAPTQTVVQPVTLDEN